MKAILTALALISLVSCEEMTTSLIMRESTTFTDVRDNTVYKTVRIGDQTWMAENLAYIDYDYYPDSVYFPTLQEEPVFSMYYDNNDCGVMYNKYAATTAAPEGWHLPTEYEWDLLVLFMDGDINRGEFLALPCKCKLDEFINIPSTWWGVGDEEWL